MRQVQYANYDEFVGKRVHVVTRQSEYTGKLIAAHNSFIRVDSYYIFTNEIVSLVTVED